MLPGSVFEDLTSSEGPGDGRILFETPIGNYHGHPPSVMWGAMTTVGSLVLPSWNGGVDLDIPVEQPFLHHAFQVTGALTVRSGRKHLGRQETAASGLTLYLYQPWHFHAFVI